MTPGISVVIPVFNGADYLAECIASVLAQTVPAQAIIIVDDGSVDDTPRIAKSFGEKVHYIRQNNRGLANARNTGHGAVRGEFLAFLDCDDLWVPQKLEWQLAACRGAGEGTICFGQVLQFASPELTETERAQLRFEAGPRPGWLASTLLLRNDDFARSGAFDESLRVGEFIEWFGRARAHGLTPLMLPDLVAKRRIHRNNLGRRDRDRRGDYSKALKKVLDRRRLQS